jgi:arginine/lysine/ornithine decarboxylase
MNFSDCASIDWSAFRTTAEWTKLLNDLLGLTEIASAPEQRAILADRLDEFADHSSSDDLDVITKLDTVARRAARSLRKEDIARSIAELNAANSEFRAVAKEFSAASVALKKEASKLRAEVFDAAVTSLTETISSLKSLSQVVATDADGKLATAIAQAILSTQELRALIERPA